MNETTPSTSQIDLYIENAREMLQVAQLNIDNAFYSSAINRAYYAMFYTATALLLTKGIVKSKHKGVIASFREQFIKTGLIEVEYSRMYGQVMDARVDSDYDLTYDPDEAATKATLTKAHRFVQRGLDYLQTQGMSR